MRLIPFLLPLILFSCDGMQQTSSTKKICNKTVNETVTDIGIENNWLHLGIGASMGMADCKPVGVNDILLDLRSNGQVRGTSSCNSFSGNYSAVGGKMQISGFGVTEKLCGSPEDQIMVWENKFLNAFQQVNGYEIVGNSLRLKTNNGSDLFFLVASE